MLQMISPTNPLCRRDVLRIADMIASVNDMLADARRQVQGISSMPNQRIRRGSAHRSDPPMWVGAEISAVLIGARVLLEPELVGGALLGARGIYALPLVARILLPVATTAVRLGYYAVNLAASRSYS
jgi:hypothetical protein